MDPRLPSGTVTFLFTDIEGSTALWERVGAALTSAVDRHHALLKSTVEAHGGVQFKVIGDGTQAAFPTAPRAVAAALEAQHSLLAEGLGQHLPFRVRMALHSGGAIPDERGDYLAPSLNRLARLLSAAHGGQVLLSEVAAGLARSDLPEGAALRDLGEHRLRDLQEPERVFQLSHPSLADEFPALMTINARPNNLPRQPTPFLGRAKEVAAVVKLLRRDAVQLLTLTGPGGVGKTRLALQAATDLLEIYTHGAWFVDLAPISDPALLSSVVIQTLGVFDESGQTPAEVMADYLSNRSLLLILDNFEHILPAATVIADQLTISPHLKILVTSRRSLRLSWEHEFQVEPMTSSDAVVLFEARAKARRPNFALTDDNDPVVEEICARLDRLPLAIELAAVRTNLSSPTAILARLQHRLDLPPAPADANRRHHTLREAIKWSYDLLPPSEQALFRRLCVFAGGSSVEIAVGATKSAGSQARDVLPGLETLVEMNLLRSDEAEGHTPRFYVLETIREFALEELNASGELENLREYLLDSSLELVQPGTLNLHGVALHKWLDRMQLEHDNLRAALEWAVETSNIEKALLLVSGLEPFWWMRGHVTEGRAWIRRILGKIKPANRLERIRALEIARHLSVAQSDYESISSFSQEILNLIEAVEDQLELAEKVGLLAKTSLHWLLPQDVDRLSKLCERTLTTAEGRSDTRACAEMLGMLGRAAFQQEDYPLAKERLEAAAELWDEVGDDSKHATLMIDMIQLATIESDFDKSMELCDELMVMAEQSSNPDVTSAALFAMHELAMMDRDLDEQIAVHERQLELARETGNVDWAAHQLHEMSLIFLSKREHEKSLALEQESIAIWKMLQNNRETSNSLRHLGNILRHQGSYLRAVESYESALNLSTNLRDDWSIAATLNDLGYLALLEEDKDKAESLFTQAIRSWKRTEGVDGLTTSLRGLRHIAHHRGEHSKATRILENEVALGRASWVRTQLAIRLFPLQQLMQRLGNYSMARDLDIERELVHQDLVEAARFLDPLEPVYEGPLQQLDSQPIGGILLRQILKWAKSTNDADTLVAALRSVGSALAVQGEIAEAEGILEEALTLLERKRHQSSRLEVLLVLAETAQRAHEFDRSLHHALRAKLLADQTRIEWAQDEARIVIGDLACESNNFTEAAFQYSSALLTGADEELQIRFLVGIADVAIALNAPTAAARWFGCVDAAREADRYLVNLRDFGGRFELIESKLLSTLAQEVHTSEWQGGRQLTLEQAVPEARDYAMVVSKKSSGRGIPGDSSIEGESDSSS
jgi:predicted ATPase/class 3 adenylate cyclase